MRICVENGTFTVAFLKEGVQKVVLTLHSLTLFAHKLAVPRLDRRFAQDILGRLSRHRCSYREP